MSAHFYITVIVYCDVVRNNRQDTDLPSSVILSSRWCSFLTDVSELPISRILKGQEVLYFLMSARYYHHTLRNVAEERRFYLLRDGSLESRNA